MKFDLFDLKSLLNLDDKLGKKLVTVVYYLGAIAIAVNVVVSFIWGISLVATGGVMEGLGKILFCLPLGILYLLVLRLLCEVVNAILEHCSKE